MPHELEGFFEDLVHMHRFEHRLGGPGEPKQLVHQRIDPVDLMPDQIRKRFPKIRILVTLGQ